MDFTQDFKKEFLIKCGYKEISVNCWESRSYYHNKVDYIDKSIPIWIRDNEEVKENDNINSYYPYSLDIVFRKVLEEKLLKLVSNL